MTFLIIEDSPSMAALHVRYMLKSEHRIVVVANLRNAMESISIFRPDAILMDLGLPDSMPEQTLEAIDEIKKASPETVVAICSGFVTPEIIARAAALGVAEVAKKDDTFTNGMDIVQRALQNKNCTMGDVICAGEALIGEKV